MEEKRSGGAVNVKLMTLDSSDAAQQQDWSSACVCVVGSVRVKATSQTLHHHITLNCARQGEQFVLTD